VPVLNTPLRCLPSRGVAAQLEIESNVKNQFISFQFHALNSRRFQHGFDRVNLHRPTEAAQEQRIGRVVLDEVRRVEARGAVAQLEIESKT
jgi:hypothetical protein